MRPPQGATDSGSSGSSGGLDFRELGVPSFGVPLKGSIRVL